MSVDYHRVNPLSFDAVLAETVTQRSLKVPAIANIDWEVWVDVEDGF